MVLFCIENQTGALFFQELSHELPPLHSEDGFCVVFVLLGIELRALGLLDKYSDTVSHLSPALHCWWVVWFVWILYVYAHK